METTQTTVPGEGTVYHCSTRGGQQFGILKDRADRRSLLIYGGGDADVPTQTIVMDGDEADQVADLLHSRTVADRLATIERRLAGIGPESTDVLT